VGSAPDKWPSVVFGWKKSARQLAFVFWRRLPKRNGHHQPLANPNEVTNLCNTASEPNNTSDAERSSPTSITSARFIRATKAPARDAQLAGGANAQKKAKLYSTKSGAAICHVPTLTTAPAGTKINGGTYTIPARARLRHLVSLRRFSSCTMSATGDGIPAKPLPGTLRSPGVFPSKWRIISPNKNFREQPQQDFAPLPLWGSPPAFRA